MLASLCFHDGFFFALKVVRFVLVDDNATPLPSEGTGPR